MDAGPLIGKILLLAIVAPLMILVTRVAQRSRRYEPGRATGPAGPYGAAQSVDIPRQRPARFLKTLGLVIMVCGGLLLLPTVFVGDLAGVLVLGLLAASGLASGVFLLQCYQNWSLVDAPTMTIMTDSRGRERRILHEEITKYYASGRNAAVVRDHRRQKLTISVVWFSVPRLAHHLMQLEAEGRFAGKHLGDARWIGNRLESIEAIFRVRFPEPYKAILIQGPGANPAAFQRDPAAPAGTGWAGPSYNAWLQALQAALAGR